MENLKVYKNFYPDYKLLREEFVANFKNSKSTDSKRFVWDYWYDNGQYNLIRTPAYLYFNEKNYQNFHSFLVQWGRENLGCHDISPPWLSYYIDGCHQRLHSDVPHGPWAFVYSLTPNKKEFSGGETLILKDKTLNYWSHFKNSKNYEYENFVDIVPSFMNQLTVFDPRFPHGVTEVKGTRDPLKGRLVMHGWFVNPRPYVTGGLSTAQVHKAMKNAFTNLSVILQNIELLDGAVSIRLNVDKKGEVSEYRVLTNTLISIAHKSTDLDYLQKELKKIFTAVKFPTSKSQSKITLPLIFK